MMLSILRESFLFPCAQPARLIARQALNITNLFIFFLSFYLFIVLSEETLPISVAKVLQISRVSKEF